MCFSRFTIPDNRIMTHSTKTAMIRGHMWLDGIFHDETSLAPHLIDIDSPEDFKSFIQSLNGCYSIYKETDTHILMASDIFGTYPLFYAVIGKGVFVSDNVECISRETGLNDINENTAMDITYTGYPYLNETMIDGIYQVIASELITIRKTDKHVNVQKHYEYVYEPHKMMEAANLNAKFNQVCLNVSERLVKSLGGRKCFVFLSGGVDSRFCAYLLKLAGYSDKTALVTYGSRLSPDYRPAKLAASSLGMRHVFIPYRQKDWRGTYTDPESIEYLEYSQNLCISSHIREHFVIRHMLDEGLMTKDDIIVPGHLGTVAGRPYTKEQLSTVDSTHRRLISQTALFYNMSRFKDAEDYLWERTAPLFTDQAEGNDPMHYLAMYNNAAACTYSIKYLINSLRAYDFYGMQWRLPLLDNEILDFFNHLPFEQIVSKKFMEDYMADRINVPLSDFSLNFVRKVFRNILDARYACINPRILFKMKNAYNRELPLLVRAYRYLRNFSSYCSVSELEMMKKRIRQK